MTMHLRHMDKSCVLLIVPLWLRNAGFSLVPSITILPPMPSAQQVWQTQAALTSIPALQPLMPAIAARYLMLPLVASSTVGGQEGSMLGLLRSRQQSGRCATCRSHPGPGTASAKTWPSSTT